jgi:hypothetical protein
MNRRITLDVWAAAILFEIVAFCTIPAWKVGVLNVLLFGVALPFVLIERQMRAAIAIAALIFVFDMVKWGYWKVPVLAPLVMLLTGCTLDQMQAARLITVHF